MRSGQTLLLSVCLLLTWASHVDAGFLIFEAEDLPITEGRIEPCAGVNGVRFATKTGTIAAPFTLEQTQTAEIWVRVYFRWAGDGVRVKIDDAEPEVLPHRIKGKRVWNDGEHSEVWHWTRTHSRELSKGSHKATISTTDSYGGWIDKIAVIYEAAPWSIPEIGGPAATLHGRTPEPANRIVSAERSTVVEAESLERINGRLTRISPGGNLCVRLEAEGAYLCGLVAADTDTEREVWCRVRYENKNIFEAPVLQEYSQALYLTLDGAQIKTFYETNEKRWHWVSTGRLQITKGTHALMFHKRGRPVSIDKVVFFSGDDRWKEDWFSKQYPHGLPFGIENSVPFDHARRAGDWRIFGALASEAEGRWLGERDGPADLPTNITIKGRKPGQLVLEKLRPVASNASLAVVAPEQQLSVWVRGDASGVRLRAIVRDRAGEAFQVTLTDRVDWRGWRLVSVSLPRTAGLSIPHEGGNADGVLDYPVSVSHLVLQRTDTKKVELVLGEPFFESPFQLTVPGIDIEDLVVETKDRRGKTIRDESQARATARVAITNSTEQPREAHLYQRFAPCDASHSPTISEAPFHVTSAVVEAGATRSLTVGPYQFVKDTGVYAFDCAIGSGKPIRRIFARGQQSEPQLQALTRVLEEHRGGFRFAPDGQDRPILGHDGKQIRKEEVPELYGKVPGLTVLVDGTDVTSRAYADRLNLRHRIRPTGFDLSDAAGWPEVRVPAGVLAIDPSLGRFKFSDGDSDPMSIAAYHITGFGVPGDCPAQLHKGYLYSCPGEGELTVMDVSDPPNARIVGFGLSWYFYRYLHFYRNYAYFNCSLRNTVLIWDDLSNPCRVGHMRSINLNRDVYGSFVGVWEDAGVAYTGSHILDLADPFNPKPLKEHGVGSLFSPEGRRYELSYLNGGARIAVVDLKNPREPKIVLEMPADSPPGTKRPQPQEPTAAKKADPKKAKQTAPKPYRIAAVHHDHFLLRSGNRLALYRRPGKPSLVAELDYNEGGPVHLGGFGFYKQHLFVVDGRKPPNQNYVWTPKYPRSRIIVYRIGRDQLTKVGSYEDPVQTNYNTLTIDSKGYAYTADMNFGVWILDFRDPTNPKKVKGIPIASEIRGGCVGENYAVPGMYFGGAHVALDVRNPLKPARKGYWWDGNYLGCRGLWQKKCASAGDVFYLPRSVCVAVVDFSDPDHPKRVGELLDAAGKTIGPCDVVQQDGILYALSKELLIYDVADPGHPKLIGHLAGVPQGVAGIRDGILFAMGGTICAVDVRDPRNPQLISELRDPYTKGGGSRGALASGYIYTIHEPSKPRTLNIFDVRDPKAMRYVRTVRLLEDSAAAPWGDYYFGWLESSGDYLYAANYEGGLDCYDISDRERPRFRSRLRNGMSWIVGEVKGDYLYEPTIQGLCVVDVPITSQVPKGKVTTR